MARFVLGRPLTTEVPTVVVDAGLLPVGVHRFRLVVVDDSGQSSAPDEVVVAVNRPLQPNGPTIRPTGGRPARTPSVRRTR